VDLKLVNANFKDQPGGWMGEVLFNTEEEARQAYAILPEFKKPGYELVIREYVVKKPIKARIRIVNGLFSPSNGVTYKGEEIQIQLLDGVNYEPTWREYFEHQGFADDTKTIRKYLKKLE